MPTIQELKDYLGIDGSQSDSLLADFLKTAQDMVETVLRFPIAKLGELPGAVKEALKYSVAFLYSNRENADIRQLEKTLATLLSGHRRKEF